MEEIKSYVERENYITIQGFMIKDLCLKGNELIIYAIIYGFSQLENQFFNGTLKYLADWTNCTKRGVIKILQSLENKGLIEKRETVDKGVKKVHWWCTKFTGGVKKVHRGGEKSSPIDNIIDKLNDNIEKENRDNNISLKESSKIKRFIKPTPDEIQAYCNERNNGIDGSMVWDFYESKGWKIGSTPMKDWKACVRTWERKRKEQEPLVEEETISDSKEKEIMNRMSEDEKRQHILKIIRGKE